MQSQIRKAIGFAVVLLLLAVSLMAATLMPVGADPESGSHTVTVKIADGQESRGTVKINVITGISTGENTYANGARIQVVATAQLGYMPSVIKIVRGSDPAVDVRNDDRDTEIQWSGSVTDDIEITVFFTEKVYDLRFRTEIGNGLEWNEGVVPPSQYTFGTAITLPTPKNPVEYTFVGWSRSGKADEIISGDFSLSPAVADKEIVLWAIYKPNQFKVTRLDKDILTGNVIGSYEFMADFGTYIKADKNLMDRDAQGNAFFKTYKGYDYNETSESYDGNTVTTAGIVITRYYTPKEYTVTLNHEDGVGGTDSVKVLYGRVPDQLAELPQRTGYQFKGYRTLNGVLYFDETGAGVKAWEEDGADQAVTLYAVWEKQNYQISLSDALWSLLKGATMNGTAYDGTPLSFAYGTTVTITVTAGDGYKLVSWNGQAIAHTKTHTLTFTVSAENVELAGIVLPVCTVPAFEVDYINERLTVEGGIPSGRYALRAGGTDYAFAGDDPLSLSNWFGSTVQILCYGDGVTKADSEWVDLVLAARPAMPTLVDGKGNGTVEKPGTDETGVTLTVTDGDTVAYEFACARNSGEKLTWQDSGVFTGLNAGTTYTFYIRMKATETAPHGEEFSISVYTLNEKFLQGEIESLRSNSDGGENVNAVIERYVTLMEAVKPGANYVNEIEALKNECLAKLAFARYQDQEIAKIRSRCEELKGQKLYNAEGEKQLESLRDTAITAICNAATKDGVDNARKAFDAGVEDIPVRIDLTGLLISLGVVILLQIIALIILLARRAKYADYVKIHRGSRVYGFALPVLALSAQFLPEKTALIALLLGILALGLQTVIMVLIFRTAAIAKSGKKRENSPTPPTKPTPAPQEPKTEYGDAFAPHLSVFRDEDAPTFAGDDADELQEEDWYDDGAADEEPSANSFSPDDSENDD